MRLIFLMSISVSMKAKENLANFLFVLKMLCWIAFLNDWSSERLWVVQHLNWTMQHVLTGTDEMPAVRSLPVYYVSPIRIKEIQIVRIPICWFQKKIWSWKLKFLKSHNENMPSSKFRLFQTSIFRSLHLIPS